MRGAARGLLGVGLALSTGCALPRREAKLPASDRAYVAVSSGEMPAAIERVARHAWIIAHIPGEDGLRKWELGAGAHVRAMDPFEYFGDGDVALHGVVFGTPEEIAETSHCLDVSVGGYDQREDLRRRNPSQFSGPARRGPRDAPTRRPTDGGVTQRSGPLPATCR